MAVLGNFMKWEEMRILAFGSISGSYTSVGNQTDPSVHLFKIVNNTDKLLLFSWNATTNHMAVPAGSALVIDINANKSTNHLFLGSNETLYVKHEGSAPTVGNLYFSTMYGGTKAD